MTKLILFLMCVSTPSFAGPWVDGPEYALYLGGKVQILDVGAVIASPTLQNYGAVTPLLNFENAQSLAAALVAEVKTNVLQFLDSRAPALANLPQAFISIEASQNDLTWMPPDPAGTRRVFVKSKLKISFLKSKKTVEIERFWLFYAQLNIGAKATFTTMVNRPWYAKSAGDSLLALIVAGADVCESVLLEAGPNGQRMVRFF